eukprot:TRINITY_DN4243_c0_g1_i2.p1 TRINITY_DN4243_c0_g1~~TRINITY_DN4243_c0_g1_i2.p1  ORF type:complete len:326 (+),score=44.15 TRINITY_DN4243_c0_g1_i2:83-979(+)
MPPTNIVQHLQYVYATLDDASTDGCALGFQPTHCFLSVPDGWELVPQTDKDAVSEVIAKYPWGTRSICLGNGDAFNTSVHGFAGKKFASGVLNEENGQYAPAAINYRILIRRRLNQFVQTPSCKETLGGCLWNDRVFTDCHICSEDGASIPAHRCVLSARSVVLQRMLESDMQEGRACKVTLYGTKSADVNAFLHYLYNSSIPDAAESLGRKRKSPADNFSDFSALVLAKLADMYSVPGLLKSSLDIVVTTVNVDNVVEVVQFMNKRKDQKIIAGEYKKLIRVVRGNSALLECLMDRL